VNLDYRLNINANSYIDSFSSMIKLTFLFLFISTVTWSQNPSATLKFSINYGNKYLLFGKNGTSETIGPDLKKKVFKFYSDDKKFMIVVSRRDSVDYHQVSLDSHFYDEVPGKNNNARVVHELGWRGNSAVEVVNLINKEKMSVTITDIRKLTFAIIKFRSGNYSVSCKTPKNTGSKWLKIVGGDEYYAYFLKADSLYRHIYLKTYLDVNSSKKISLKNIKDSVYIMLNKSQNGFKTSYSFQRRLPDGKYKVYINGALDRILVSKNKVQTDISHEYRISTSFESKKPTPVFYHKSISLVGHTGARSLFFQRLIASDDAFFKFSEVTDKRDIGFYMDTLTRDLFYNNYEIDNSTIDLMHKLNFDKIYDIGKINHKTGSLALTKHIVNNESFSGFFTDKVNLNEFMTRVNGKVNAKSRSYSESFFVDLNSDGIKEKIQIILSLDMETPFDERGVSELEFRFFRPQAESWLLYDSIKLTDELEKYIDQIVIFKQRTNGLANIYINSSSFTKSGKDFQTQILLVGSTDIREIKFTK
jgi:hypothetical protein